MLSGNVTVRKVPHGVLPMLMAASSKLGSMALSTAVRVKNATGKYVRVSAIHVPQKPYILKSGA